MSTTKQHEHQVVKAFIYVNEYLPFFCVFLLTINTMITTAPTAAATPPTAPPTTPDKDLGE